MATSTGPTEREAHHFARGEREHAAKSTPSRTTKYHAPARQVGKGEVLRYRRIRRGRGRTRHAGRHPRQSRWQGLTVPKRGANEVGELTRRMMETSCAKSWETCTRRFRTPTMLGAQAIPLPACIKGWKLDHGDSSKRPKVEARTNRRTANHREDGGVELRHNWQIHVHPNGIAACVLNTAWKKPTEARRSARTVVTASRSS